jgi:antitoxin (DNA-binding transcriptional repressor) of toxin-antitoxin stability system
MKLSIREARAQFSKAIEAAIRGERVVITRNGRPVAELNAPKAGLNWEALDRYRAKKKWKGLTPAEVWPEQFDDPALSRELLGVDDGWDPARR